jgi:hypothetical protein
MIGDMIENAEAGVWHSMGGEWTGELFGAQRFYFNTYNNNSDTTTYYIDNFHIEIESKGKRELVNNHKPLKDMVMFIKNIIPADISGDFMPKPMFQKIADAESLRRGILSFRDFMYIVCDCLIDDSNLYDKPPKKPEPHARMVAAYPFLHNVKSVLINIGYHGELARDALIIADPLSSSHEVQVF